MSDATLHNLEPLRFPLSSSRLIEASAGTGKTYTIAALYLRLVLNHGGEEHAFGRLLRPDQILVVTYTEAATAELRDRIRARLTEAARYFAEQADSDDRFLQDLRRDFEATEWPQLARRLELAAQAMDDAAVHTIHGWCNRMLREHAFASGSLFSQQLNTDQQGLWEDAARDYWRTFISSLGDSPSAVEQCELIQKAVGDPLRLARRAMHTQQQLRQVAQHTQVDPHTILQSWQQQRDQALAQLRSEQHLLQDEFAELRVYCEGLYKQSDRVNTRSYQKQWVDPILNEIDDWVVSLSSTAATLAPDLKPNMWFRVSLDGMEKVLHEPVKALRAFTRLAAIKQQAESLQQPQAALLEHALRWVAKRAQQLQQQNGEMGFDDMLTRLQDALNGPQGEQFADLIRAQFPLAMIDEFQDTDPIQYDIFNRVYQLAQPRPDSGIILIGDPKQAIYSFRNADIFTYLQARQDTQGRHYTLMKNYRSSAAMVQASNQFFLAAQDYPQGVFRFKDGADDPVPYVEVEANGRDQAWHVAGKEASALQFNWYVNDEAAALSEHQLRQQLADRTAEQISHLLSDPATGFANASKLERLQPGDIAILVSDGKEATAMRRALSKRQLRSVYLSERDSVFAGQTAIELYHIIRACADPFNDRRLRAALATDLCHLPWQQLEHELGDELAWDRRVEQFQRYQQRWQQAGILAMLEAVWHEFDIPRYLLQRVGGERTLTDLLHLAELLQQQSRVLEGSHALLRYLSEQIDAAQEQQRTDNNALQIRLESDSKLIQIVTIHKSKGLQYPVVFLPFVGRTRAASFRPDQAPLVYHTPQGQLQLAFENSSTAVEYADAERLAEDIRKLYVAMTRAEFATYVGIAPFNSFSQSALHYLLTGTSFKTSKDQPVDYQRVRERIQHEINELDRFATVTSVTVASEPAPELAVCTLPQEFKRTPWWVASYSALRFGAQTTADTTQDNTLLESKYDDVPQVEQSPRADTIHAFAKGAQPGTFLHNILEQAANDGFARLAAADFDLSSWLAPHTELPKWQPYHATLVTWLRDYLNTSFVLADTEVALQQLQTYQAEPEFWFNAEQVDAQTLDRLVQAHILPGQARPTLDKMQLNGMLKGFIDLTFEWQGRYYVCDYKSNYLGADASAYTHEAMQAKILAARYDLQYVLYTLALHRILKARLGSKYCYETHIGGALYLFLRGAEAETRGAFFDRPPAQLITQLDKLFDGAAVAVKEPL
ncbi:exodeoxyribonuclease V subunit beta [Pseudidiomarina taiwanensis]|uniref:RecBCD enzyme subunit RecB n=1 Tax=Pseudidiomarina taiwanensis TaxID=337250 RepID=A0A432ZFP0_9GAMM|nr:exodeoxyribonuclease V subunit beta [Pseudidiomarina taiwanensis]RUO76795.1 exodeoxyribonuclease V subunit beta [Pseudidiomarina taiwanensis]